MNEELQAGPLVFVLFVVMLLGEEHAGEDEGGAEDEVEGDLLVKNGPGEDNGDYGIEIDVVGADNGTKFSENPVPSEKTGHGGNAAKEQQIGQQTGLTDNDIDTKTGIDGEIRYHGYKTIEKHLAGDENGIVALGGGNHQQTVERPAEAGHEGQGIAKGREMEHKATIHHHYHNACCCQKGAKGLHTIKALRLIDKAYQGGGKQWTETDDDGGIGSGGVVHGAILGEEIERTAHYTQHGQKQLVAPRCGKQTAALIYGIDQEQHVGDGETEHKYLCCGHAAKEQQLGENESRAPDGCHQERYYMIKETIISHLVYIQYLGCKGTQKYAINKKIS